MSKAGRFYGQNTTCGYAARDLALYAVVERAGANPTKTTTNDGKIHGKCGQPMQKRQQTTEKLRTKNAKTPTQ
ncbi:hypothetical protein, partial [Gardnerella sp. Marseille-QA0894]|uniref:hypothetical protein n=1 Tax=Gardnerella sp. Marseille-QA0894 TaxID=3383031 RepID=UPI003AF5D69B